MSDSLDQSLSQLSEAADLMGDEEVQEVARVRSARARVTEDARQRGDTVGDLLSGLIGESNAEIEAERLEKERKIRENEEKARLAKEAEEERKRQEAEAKLEEEKRLFEEKEQRRLKMVADLEKKRKKEAGEIDEEEEARKRQEAEAEAARIQAEKEKEAAEAAALRASNDELAEKIRLMKEQKAAEAAAEAKAKKKQKWTVSILAGIFVALVAVVVGWYLINLKAPDFYKLVDEYPLTKIDFDPSSPVLGFTETEIAYNEVVQEAPKVERKRSGAKKDKYSVVDLGGDSIVK